jgi:hypothetical protein
VAPRILSCAARLALVAALASPTVMALPGQAPGRCTNEPMRSTGTTHYFCDCQPGAASGCVPGDDGRTRLQARNPKTPWRTANKARAIFLAMNAGDTVALCRGGAFDYSGGGSYDLWRNTRCRANKTCDFRDYPPPWGSGSEGRPFIQVTDGGHFLHGTHRGGADPADAVQGFRFLNLSLKAGKAYSGFAFNPAHYMDDIMVCDTVIDGFAIGVYQGDLVRRATYRGNRFLNNAQDAILATADNLVIDGNYFDNNGHNVRGGDPFHHTIYLEGASSKDIWVTNNEIHRSTMSGGASGTGNCSGTILVAHGGFDGLTIENNYIDAPSGGCWGLSLTGGGLPRYCYFRNTAIRRNRIQNVGNMSLGVESCTNCVIEDNLIVAGPDPSGIVVPTSACTCTKGCDTNTGAIIRNNTIYFPGSAPGIAAIRVTTEGTGHVVANNAILVEKGSGTSCFSLPLPKSSYRLVDHNLCYGAGRWELSRGSLSAWRAATGFDTSSLDAAPKFVNVPADFTPAAGSPLVGAAHPVEFSPAAMGSAAWSPSDAGKKRDAGPDIGAFER